MKAKPPKDIRDRRAKPRKPPPPQPQKRPWLILWEYLGGIAVLVTLAGFALNWLPKILSGHREASVRTTQWGRPFICKMTEFWQYMT